MLNLPETSYQLNLQKMQTWRNCASVLRRHLEGIGNFKNRLVGLIVDVASVNLGIQDGLSALIKNDAPWLEVIHCFKHIVELAVKGTLKNDTYFN